MNRFYILMKARAPNAPVQLYSTTSFADEETALSAAGKEAKRYHECDFFVAELKVRAEAQISIVETRLA